MLSKTPQFTPFGQSLSSLFSPVPMALGNTPLSHHTLEHGKQTLSVEEIMKSSFVPTPRKVGSMFSPEPKMNMSTALSDRQANTGAVVPISMEKKRKIESTGGYFRRMGSPSFRTKKENVLPAYAEKQRVSNVGIIVYNFCSFAQFFFSQLLCLLYDQLSVAHT